MELKTRCGLLPHVMVESDFSTHPLFSASFLCHLIVYNIYLIADNRMYANSITPSLLFVIRVPYSRILTCNIHSIPIHVTNENTKCARKPRRNIYFQFFVRPKSENMSKFQFIATYSPLFYWWAFASSYFDQVNRKNVISIFSTRSCRR